MLRFSFRFFSIIFIVGIFFGLTNGACSPDMNSGIGTLPSSCAGGTNNTPSRFNNNQSYGALTTFLRAYGFTFDKIDCTSSSQVGDASSKVQTIQNVLTELSTILGKDCGTCIDGKFGLHTQSKISECAPTCTSPNKPVNATDPICDDGYIHDGNIGCCKPNCSGGGKSPQNQVGGCDSGLTGDGGGCCIAIVNNCLGPILQSPGANGSCVSGWTGDGGGCCVSISPIGTGNGSGNINGTGNNCTATGQVGTQSGASRTCKDCEPGTAPNLAHTKCICSSSGGNCCGIKLNTVVPFIGDCIEMNNDDSAPSAGNTTRVNALNAFPILMGSLSKILVTAILIFSFVMVVVGGVMIISGGIDESNFKKGKDIIYKVIMALALLGASGIILRLINPNFFG